MTDLIRANKGSGDVTVIILNEKPALSSFATACAAARACEYPLIVIVVVVIAHFLLHS